MAIIAYHASHEQFTPSDLLKLAIKAEQLGFSAIHSSDHFHPWSERQGQSGFSFSWLGAAMQATTIPFSVVCAPGQRYHPAIIAQAAATLAQMFTGRFSIEIGSGEALNESITAAPWPPKQERNDRLLECFHIIKALLRGEEVTHYGNVKIKEAKLYTLPEKAIPVFGAAISQETCEWAASWAEGLLTTGGPFLEVESKIKAFRRRAGATKPVFLQYSFSYARNPSDALNDAHSQWRTNLLPAEQLNNITKPAHFDALTKNISTDQLTHHLDVSSDLSFFKNRIQSFLSLGIERLILHNVNRRQDDFLEDFSKLL